MCEINKNIQEMLKEKKLSQKKLSSFIDVSTSTVNNWLKLGRSIPSEYIIPICEFFEISPERLLLGKSIHYSLTPEEKEMLNLFNKVDKIAQARLIERAEVFAEEAEALRQKEMQQESNNLKAASRMISITEDSDKESENCIEIPLYDTCVSAGTGIDIDYTSSDPIQVSSDEFDDTDFAVRVSGDSMEPRYSDGDIVIVEPTPAVDQGEVGIFILNGQAYIKKLGDCCLISLNNSYEPIKINDYDSIYCQGRVIGVIPHK